MRALHAAFELGEGGIEAEPRGRDEAGRASRSSAPPASSARTMLEVLRERGFPADEIVLFASERSARREIDGPAPCRCSTTTPT